MKQFYLRQDLLRYLELPVMLNSDMDILAPIASYDYSVAGNNAADRYNIERAIEIEDGVRLVIFACGFDDEPGIEQTRLCTAAVVYDDGDVFVLSDWQGGYPDKADEIADYEWICASTGRRAVILDGLPRVLVGALVDNATALHTLARTFVDMLDIYVINRLKDCQVIRDDRELQEAGKAAEALASMSERITGFARKLALKIKMENLENLRRES